SITPAGIVEAINDEVSFTNRKLKVRVYTYLSGTTLAVSKLVSIGIDIDLNLEDSQLAVQITHAERTGRYAALDAELVIDNVDDAQKVYAVSAAEVIPDTNLRNFLFYRFDKTPFGVISLSERNTSVNYFDASNKGIGDITGMDLFPRLQRWILTGNRIVSLPQLYILPAPAGTLYELTLYRNVFLKDISNLGFSGGAGYVSLGSKITYIDLRECHSLDDSQTEYFSELTSLTRINLNSMKIGDYSGLQSLYKTLTTLWIDNYRTYANNNNHKISKLIADSYNAVPLSSINGLNVILQQLVETEPQYAADGVTEHDLPTTFKIPGYDKQYDLVWAVPDGVSAYSVTGSTLIIQPSADAVITLNATATYFEGQQRNTYTEAFQLVTSKVPDMNNLYDRTQGQIWSRFINAYVDIETVMPDPVLRYYFFKYLNTDGNTQLSAAELTLDQPTANTLAFNDSLPYISSLQGIEYIISVDTLTIGRGYTYDFSPLAQLETLKSLTINNNQLTIHDVSFLDNLKELTSLNLSSSGVTNYGFLMDNASITSISNINHYSRSTVRYAMYNRIAWAFARMYNEFSDNASVMGDNNVHVSAANEKYASIVLDQLDIALQTGSFYRVHNVNNIINLPQTCGFWGKDDYTVSWQSLSQNVTIIGDKAYVSNSHYDTDFPLIARIDYDNGSYEKLFIVRYAE
ncbi:MAG: leucine-rich repeat domain-containing protein, partial [Clostridia bacterium]|nr:leucine-rich repeat domain-containing protein [Clostridia bacterium]